MPTISFPGMSIKNVEANGLSNRHRILPGNIYRLFNYTHLAVAVYTHTLLIVVGASCTHVSQGWSTKLLRHVLWHADKHTHAHVYYLQCIQHPPHTSTPHAHTVIIVGQCKQVLQLCNVYTHKHTQTDGRSQ